MSNSEKYISNLKWYLLWLPFSGIILIFILSCYYFVIQQEPVTIWRILSIFIPFGIGFLISLPFNMILGKRPPYLLGKFKYISLLLIMLSTLVIFSQRDNINIPIHEPSELDNIISNQEEISYIIFSSDKCPFCVEMKPTYRKIANQYKNVPIYYIDLTDQSFKMDPIVMGKINELNIEKIPTLIQIEGGEVSKQLVGNKSIEDLEEFFGN